MAGTTAIGPNDPPNMTELITTFRTAISKECTPLPDEPNFHTSNRVLTDFLRARKYHLEPALALLKDTVEWRRKYKPLSVDCKYCHEKPGLHSIRQIGHDRLGRPVFYACFAQAATNKNHAEDTILHCVQLLEAAKKTFKNSASQVDFIFDCSGMTLPCCNPKLGRSFMNVFANYYPELLGKALIVNHKPIFKNIWRAIKKFLDPVTANKVAFLKDKKGEGAGASIGTLMQSLNEYFEPETAQWLYEEITLNREINEAQMRFWEKPASPHDPRGAPPYVREYVASGCGVELLHPNIADRLTGRLAPNCPVVLPKSSGKPTRKEELEEYGIEDVADSDNNN